MQQVDIYIYIPQKARIPKPRERTYRYMLVCRGMEGHPLKGGGEAEEGASGHRIALRCAVDALSRMTRPAEITVHSDCYYLVNGWESIGKWAGNGWKKADGKQVKNTDLWLSLLRLEEEHQVRFTYERKIEEIKADKNS